MCSCRALCIPCLVASASPGGAQLLSVQRRGWRTERLSFPLTVGDADVAQSSCWSGVSRRHGAGV